MTQFFRVSLASALVLGSCTMPPVEVEAKELSRVSHDHTIYVLRGDLELLEKFDGEIVSDWGGGELLSKDTESGTYTYWAYSERTARQARSFIMPATFAGFSMETEAYDESLVFPEQRGRLDEIATSCGFDSDPFLVLPDGTLKLVPSAKIDHDKLGCAMQAVAADDSIPEILTPNVDVQTYKVDEGA